MKVRFGPFILDTGTRQLIRDAGEIRLSPKAFDFLCVLLERRPRVVDKAELQDRLWPGTFVVDTNLSVLIGEIRRALGDTPQDSRFIRTVHKAGYAFCGEVIDLDTAAPPLPSAPATCWLVLRAEASAEAGAHDRTFVLTAGENILGRAPNCQIWLDVSGVSRRHARIDVASDGRHASIEDLASTNGTFVRGARVVARTELSDGDTIEVGSVTLTLRMWASAGGRRTERIKREE